MGYKCYKVGLRHWLLYLAHEIRLSGHQAAANTLAHLTQRFYWPGIRAQVEQYCKDCPECQLTRPKGPNGGPLQPMPIVFVPFEYIGVDFVGPLTPSTGGHCFILAVVDYATRYPEAMWLRKALATTIAQELATLFTWVWFPKQVVSYQKTAFMGKILKALAQLVGMQALHMTVYHPQTNRLVEHFNGTLKCMIRKFITDGAWDWQKWLSFLMFAIREFPQASLGLSPF